MKKPAVKKELKIKKLSKKDADKVKGGAACWCRSHRMMNDSVAAE